MKVIIKQKNGKIDILELEEFQVVKGIKNADITSWSLEKERALINAVTLVAEGKEMEDAVFETKYNTEFCETQNGLVLVEK